MANLKEGKSPTIREGGDITSEAELDKQRKENVYHHSTYYALALSYALPDLNIHKFFQFSTALGYSFSSAKYTIEVLKREIGVNYVKPAQAGSDYTEFEKKVFNGTAHFLEAEADLVLNIFDAFFYLRAKLSYHSDEYPSKTVPDYYLDGVGTGGETTLKPDNSGYQGYLMIGGGARF